MERERHAIISTCTKEKYICITESKSRETNLDCKTDLNCWLDLHIFVHVDTLYLMETCKVSLKVWFYPG